MDIYMDIHIHGKPVNDSSVPARFCLRRLLCRFAVCRLRSSLEVF